MSLHTLYQFLYMIAFNMRYVILIKLYIHKILLVKIGTVYNKILILFVGWKLMMDH